MVELKLSRNVKTFTFRLALVYVGLFSLSVIVLFAFIYTFARNYMQTQISDSLRMQYYYLVDAYKENGSSAIEERIEDLIANDPEGTAIYLLVNREYEKLAGNLNEWPTGAQKLEPFEKEGSWVRFHIEGPRISPKGIEVRAIAIPLSKWRSVLVGQTLQSSEKIEQTIVQTFWASLLLTLVMAFFGALVMARSVMRRLGVLNRSADTIMRGHLSERFPYTVGGDEFDELSANLNLMLDTTQNLMESLSQFANNIAHDLRSPLNRIINRLDEGLRSIDRKNPAFPLLEKNIRDLEGLVGTFNSILNITELEANTEFRQFSHCDLRLILTDLVDFYSPYAEEKHIEFLSAIDGPLVVDGEKNLLTQAFANLIDNAIKFTPRGGRIEVSAYAQGTKVEVIIADSGPGIPGEYHDKVFEKFFRLEESRNTMGNGLGLSLVSAIARIHNAKIILEDNQPGLRIRFKMELAGS